VAVIYLRSTDGDDADDGSTWALAKATLAGAFAAAAAGDTIYVSHQHAENTAGALSLVSPGTAAAPCLVLCVNDGAAPPTALATTATVSTDATFGANISFTKFCYYYGISFLAGVSASNARHIYIGTASDPWWIRFDSCKLKLMSTQASVIQISAAAASADDALCEWVNCEISFGNASNNIAVSATHLIATGCTLDAAATLSTTLFITGQSHSSINAKGCDLSPLAAGKSLVSVAGAGRHLIDFENCKLGSAVALTTGTIPGQGGAVVRLVNCDSADTQNRYQKTVYQGSIFSDTGCVRTGGATDGTTAVARKMVSSAATQFYSPLETDPIRIWNETVGSEITVECHVVTDNVTLTDAECWLEVEYQGTSGFPQSLFASDRSANILATPAAQTASTATWSGTVYDALGTPVKQKLSVSFTPQEKGWVTCRVLVAKASTTVYVCPKVELSTYSPSLVQMTPGGSINSGVYPAVADVEDGVFYRYGDLEGTLAAGGGGGGGRRSRIRLHGA
jgi:hypothetical protein